MRLIGKECENSSAVYFHYKSEHPTMKYGQCFLCPNIYSSNSALSSQIKETHEVCGIRISYPQQKVEERKIKTENTEFD